MAKWVVRTVKGKKEYYRDGVQKTKADFDRAFPDKPIGPPMTAAPANWQNFESIALAVHPDQVAEATARNKRNGVNVTYKPDGTAVIPDRAARTALMRLEGMHDNEGCYGD